MSHQTGITANEELRTFFANSKGGNIRLIKVSIENEELVLSKSLKVNGNWEQDYDAMVMPLIEDEMPAYILFRFDSKNNTGYEWLFIAWSPDFAPIRQKMLYAGTRATLKSSFGGSHIKDELFGTARNDVSFDGYQKHLQAALAPAPLTAAEEELKLIKESEVRADVSATSKSQTLSGIAFPFEPEATNAVIQFKDQQVNYVQLCLNLEKETVGLAMTDQLSVDQIKAIVPTDSGRYHLYNFSHTHEGDFMTTAVFIYSMPGYKCSVKERMLYSSCKAPLTDHIGAMGIDLVKKIEVDDANEITEEFIMDQVHPKKNIVRQAFAKPKGPPGRGVRRIMKQKE